MGKVSEREMAEARRVLGQQLYGMFAAMPTQYRRHALNVYHRVREAGCQDPHVLQAALLHDAGKHDPLTGRHVTLAHRVAIVLLRATPPGKRLLSRLAQHANPRGLWGYLFYPFYLGKHHALLAAMRATQHGAHPRVVTLIANHHRHDHADPALAALQAADEAS